MIKLLDMKANLHPTYYSDTLVTCACGHSFTTGSTLKEIKVEICSHCHPFYTGEARFVDTQGRVEKFQAKMNAAVGLPKRQAKKGVPVVSQSPKSLREMLTGAKPAKA